MYTQVETTLDELGSWCAGCVAENMCSTLEKIIGRTTNQLEVLLLQFAWTKLKYICSKSCIYYLLSMYVTHTYLPVCYVCPLRMSASLPVDWLVIESPLPTAVSVRFWWILAYNTISDCGSGSLMNLWTFVVAELRILFAV